MKPRTLVVVITHPEAEPILRMTWPWIKRSGCDVLVVDHEDAPRSDFALWHIGRAPDLTVNRWVGRFNEVLLKCLEDDDNYNDWCLIESDCVFVRPLPPHPGGLVTTLAGGRSPGFLGKSFFHTPWHFDRPTAEEYLRCARHLLDIGLNEQGFIDRFIGLVNSIYPHLLNIMPADWFTANTIQPAQYAEVNAGFKSRRYYGAHGVKTEECLRAITEGL